MQRVVCVYSQFEELCLLWVPLFHVLKYTVITFFKVIIALLFPLWGHLFASDFFSTSSDFGFNFFLPFYYSHTKVIEIGLESLLRNTFWAQSLPPSDWKPQSSNGEKVNTLVYIVIITTLKSLKLSLVQRNSKCSLVTQHKISGLQESSYGHLVLLCAFWKLNSLWAFL